MLPPLAGIRVLELARVLAGPYAAQVLADLGAEVVKVESLRGDETREWGPPNINSNDPDSDAAYFHAANRNKRSIAVDFSKPEGADVVRRLAARSDVLIENFKVGGLAKYDLDYTSLSARNPRLIYCSITGFGQDGPYAHRAGYDFIIQGMGGIMDLTGDPEGEPMKVGVAYADLFTGLYAVIAIQAALAHRDKTGKGQHIDMALLDSQVGVLANQAMNYFASGQSPGRLGNAHPNIVPYRAFPVADGHIIIAAGNDNQFRRLVAVLGAPQMSEEEDFAGNAARVSNRTRLEAELAVLTRNFKAAELLARLDEAQVPAGPINTVEQVFNDPQVIARGMRVDLPDSDGSPTPSVRTPIRMSESPLAYRNASPRLGEQTDTILTELGYTDDAIRRLHQAGTVARSS